MILSFVMQQPQHSANNLDELPSSVSDSRKNLLWAFAILTLITWIVGILVPHHVPISPQTEIHQGFPGTSEDWTFTGQPCEVQFKENELVINRSDPGTSFANFRLSPNEARVGDESAIEIRMHAKCRLPKFRNVRKPRGAVYVSQHDSSNKKIGRTLIGVFRGRGGEGHWSVVVRPKKETKSYEIKFGLLACQGEMSLSDLKFQFVKSYLPFQWVFGALSFAWSAFSIFVVIHFFKSGQARSLWLPAILVGIIVIGIFLPVDMIYGLLLPLDDSFNRLHAEYPDWMLFQFDAIQLGHTLSFAAFSLVALLLRDRLRISVYQLVAVFGLLVLATEGMQLFLSNRSANLPDIGMDVAGIVVGCLAFAFISSITRVGRDLFANDANQASVDQSAGSETAPEASK